MKKVSIIFLILLYLGACASWINTKSELINKDLSLYIENKPENQNVPYILIKGDGRVSGSLGCNRLLGQATFDGTNGIKFSSMASTKMFCENNNNELEPYFLNILENTTNYKINEREGLVLFFNKNKKLLATLIIK